MVTVEYPRTNSLIRGYLVGGNKVKFLSLLQRKTDFRWIQEKRTQEKYFKLIMTVPLSSTVCDWKVLIILPIR